MPRHLIFILAGWFVLATSVWAAQTQKVGDARDLTFYLSFDRKAVTADRAAGDPNPIKFDGNLEFRTVPGPDRSNAFQIEEGESLIYPANRNANVHQGTLVMWVMAQNYDPGLVKMNDPNLSHKPYVLLRFSDGTHWVNMHLYQYFQDNRAMFYWNSSWKSKDYRLATASLGTIRRQKWFQLAASWDDTKIKMYLDGKFQSETLLPTEAAAHLASFRPTPKLSLVNFVGKHFSPYDPSKKTAVDEIRIYSRVLADSEIAKLYQAVAPQVGPRKKLADFDIQLDGVDDGGPLDRLQATLNYKPLNEAWLTALRAGKVNVQAKLKQPNGEIQTLSWTPTATTENHMISGVDHAGVYELDITLSGPGGKTVNAHASIERPDTSWADNQLGLEDTVPTPWTPMHVDAKNNVTVCGRTYRFTDDKGNFTPVPAQVTDEGDDLLQSGPRLMIVTGKGLANIRYKVVERDTSAKSFILYKGTGEAEDFSLTWTTRIDFDGLVRWDFQILGKPVIHSMKLEWSVNRAFSQYVLDPILKLSGNGKFSAGFPTGSTRQSSTVLWLTSDKKGFCWMPEHDGNWVYQSKADTPIQVVVDEQGGHCTIDMIARATTVPQGASYHAMFIATPSRPLPSRFRTLSFGGYGRYDQCENNIGMTRGSGQDGVFSLRPTKFWPAAVKRMAKIKGLLPYASATGLNDHCLEGRYFNRYWTIPGGPIVPFFDKMSGIRSLQTNCAPHTRYSDYILSNLKQVYEHPASTKVAGIYYDLANNYICSNPLNGTEFTDAFGRKISKLIVMGLRRHLMRTLRLSRQYDKITMYHGHSYYNPAIHDFGDYWLPGEQYASLIQKLKTPYVYSDDIPDDVYRTELNMAIKGSAIRFLGNLSRANKAYGTREQTLAMCTKLLLNDVPISMAYEDGTVINQIWKVVKAYDLDHAKVIYFYDDENVVKSDNPNIKITYYQCSNNRVLLVLGNVSAKNQKAQINLTSLGHSVGVVRDEFEEKPITAQAGKIQVDIPSRQFKLIGVSLAKP